MEYVERVVQSPGGDGDGVASSGKDVNGVGGLGQGGWASDFTSILTYFNYRRELYAAYGYHGCA